MRAEPEHFQRNNRRRNTRQFLGLNLALQLLGTWEIVQVALNFQISIRSWKWMGLFGALGLLILGTALLLVLTWYPAGRRLVYRLADRMGRVETLKPLATPVIVICALVLPAVVLSSLPTPFNQLADAFFLRAFIFWLLSLVGGFFLYLRNPERSFARSLAVIALCYAALHRAAAFLPEISRDPFSLGWSEASRYYYASLFFGERIYGSPVNPTVLHPTRYLLQAIPFFLDSLPLWFHRAWQVLLWLSANSAAAWMLTKRIGKRGYLPVHPAIFAIWAFLFLFQGPIWYHLVVMVFLVLWGTDSRRFWKTLLVVGAASAWAGISRVNWIPFPAALAALIYLIEIPVSRRRLLPYLAAPLAWGIFGVVLGLFSQWAYAVLSGNALDQFTSSFTSDLLWYRLLPNATYPPGILPGILLVLLPPVWVVLHAWKGRWRQIEPVRWLGIAGILLVFFAGGLVVSVKIGGGSNLHNLDGFIALLLVASAYLVFVNNPQERRLKQLIVGTAIAVPVGFALAMGGPLPVYSPEAAAADIALLSETVGSEAESGNEVLFIAERHLLSLEMIEDVPLVEDYEKVFLMEMAMAGNPAYLGRFEQELASHRFALIVTDTLNYDIQTHTDAFGEENNVWDEHVSYPLLCYYRPLFRLQSTNVQVFEPRPEPDCPSTVP